MFEWLPDQPNLGEILNSVRFSALRSAAATKPSGVLRLKSRRGPKKAILAVAASILTAAYYILKDQATYHELGADYFERRDKAHIARRLIRRLEQLGLSVEVRPAA